MTRLSITAATAAIANTSASIDASIPDNTTGLVTPQDVRDSMQATLQAAQDALDSASTITAVMESSAPSLGVLIAATWAPIGTLVPTPKGGQAAVLTIDPGVDIEAELDGFDYELSAQIVVAAANTAVIQIVIAENGVNIGQVGQLIGDGANDLRAVTGTAVFNVAAGTKFSLMAQAPAGAVNVDILSATLQVRLVPTV
jgi:hypothetical protein